MIEDKLTHDERVRLECLAQANATAPPNAEPAKIISKAQVFAEFVLRGNEVTDG